jgi:single-strand DNA-binding protein
MNEAQVFVAGYVAREPKFRKTHNGHSYTSLRVGYTPRRMDRDSGEWSDGGTSFVTVFCWRGLADNVATCVRKGDPVLIKGKLQVRPFTDKDGAARVAVEVEASSIGHDLARGVANFQRAHRTAGETALERANTGRPGEPAADVATDGIPAAPPAGMFAEDAVAALAGAAADDPDDDAEQAVADAAEPGAGPQSDAEAVGVATPF